MRSMGFWVAEMPMRTGSCGHSAASRSSDRARWAPRFDVGHRVQLVHDHRTDRGQHLAAGNGGEQDEQRLGRGDEDVRRGPSHARPLHLGRVAGPHRRADRPRPRTPRTAPGCRPAARPGSSGCRSTAPSAATRRARGSRRAGRPGRRLPSPAHRWRRGTRRGSCPSPWARPAGCGDRPGWRARPGPATGVGAPKRSLNQPATAGWKSGDGMPRLYRVGAPLGATAATLRTAS